MKVAVFNFSMFGIVTYIVWDPETRECAVIDPGMTSDDERAAIDGFIAREHLTVTHLINTHLHIDHAIGDGYITEKYNVPLEAHHADEMYADNMLMQASMFGLPLDVDNVSIKHYIEDGDIIHIGNGTLKALHVPGHSAGSIMLYDEADGFIIAGDVLFAGSVGRTDLPGGSMTDLLTGIREKVLVLPEQTVVYPGHGPATTIGYEKKYNPFLR